MTRDSYGHLAGQLFIRARLHITRHLPGKITNSPSTGTNSDDLTIESVKPRLWVEISSLLSLHGTNDGSRGILRSDIREKKYFQQVVTSMQVFIRSDPYRDIKKVKNNSISKKTDIYHQAYNMKM